MDEQEWLEVGRGITKLRERVRGVSLHAPGDAWKVTYMVGRDGYVAAGRTPLKAVQQALALCPASIE